MDQTDGKLYVPVSFAETYEVSQLVERVKLSFPARGRSEVLRHVFRVGLNQVLVKEIGRKLAKEAR